jgi:hypothetical protein
MGSQKLEDAIILSLQALDQRAVQHEGTLHTIIAKLGEFTGGTTQHCPKSKIDAISGKRSQLPTERILPPRQQALEHARKEGLITAEEYETAIADPDGVTESSQVAVHHEAVTPADLSTMAAASCAQN